MEKKTRAATESGVLLLIIALILVAVNALSAFGGYKRIDTTKTERYSLSKGSANLLQSMKQQMHVDAYVTKGLPKLDAFVRDLRDLLQEYKQASGGKFDYAILDTKDEETKKAAREAGLKETPFAEASDTEDKAAVSMGFWGLVIKYGSEKDTLPLGDSTDGMEFWLTNKIRELRDKGDGIKTKIGVVTGKDELKLTDTNLVPAQHGRISIQQVLTQKFPFYTIEEVDLKGGDGEINKELAGLIITQPNKDYTEKELRAIDQFLMLGKSLVVIAGAVNTKPSDPSMNATLSTHGLEKLLEGYGIELRKDAVLDFSRSMRVVQQTQSGALAPIRVPQIVKVQEDPRFGPDETPLDTKFPVFFRMQEISVPVPSSVVLHADKQPEAKSQVVLRSTPNAIRLEGDTADLTFLQNWGPKIKAQGAKFEQVALGAAVEGTIKSAYDPAKKSEKTARVFVLASPQFITNPFARAGAGMDMGGQMAMMGPVGGDENLQRLSIGYAQQELTNTLLAVKNLFDYMGGDTDLLAVSAKILQEPGLVYGDVNKAKFDPNETEESFKKKDDEMKAARKYTQQKVQWSLIIGLPLLFVAYGIMRWRMKIAARENVSLA